MSAKRAMVEPDHKELTISDQCELIELPRSYLVGTSFDWDWQLFAVTLPYFLFSGIIVAYYAAETTLFE